MQIAIFLFIYVVTFVVGLFFFRQGRRRDMRLLSEITDMVHQLRTPLSGMKWSLKILLDGDAGKITAAEKELLTKNFAANQRILTLVNDILAVARLESGARTDHFVPVQFEELIEETVTSLAPLVQAKGVRIEFTAPKDPLPLWTVDAEKVRDVLVNLLDNAIKYTPKDGTITIAAKITDGKLHLTIGDTGIGIPDLVSGKIFTRFFRAANAVATEADGSGLGLFIAKNIVEHQGGKIWFESAVGTGTTFHVLLPPAGSSPLSRML